jgi:hypothetical protein
VSVSTAPARPPRPPLPQYREASLAELASSLLAALGSRRFTNPLDLEPARHICLLVVDGLGWELLKEHRRLTPFLTPLVLRGRPLTAPFPATTATSLASIATGRPPGEHGITGYSMAAKGLEGPMNTISWSLYRAGTPVDLRDDVVPEEVQRHPTLFELATQLGIETTVVSKAAFRGSGLTRAAFRGGRFAGIESLTASDGFPDAQAIHLIGRALRRGSPSLVYTYHPDLDSTGHRDGIRSRAWRSRLREVDWIAERLAAEMPDYGMLVVTGDHGMVDLRRREAQRIDLADRPKLAAGVKFMAGEARARHVHVKPGALQDVLDTWRELLGDAMWIASGEEAIEGGWFGPRVDDRVRASIGDVVAAAHGPIGIFQRKVDPFEAQVVGHHGSMTPEEQLVPLLVYRND